MSISFASLATVSPFPGTRYFSRPLGDYLLLAKMRWLLNAHHSDSLSLSPPVCVVNVCVRVCEFYVYLYVEYEKISVLVL